MSPIALLLSLERYTPRRVCAQAGGGDGNGALPHAFAGGVFTGMFGARAVRRAVVSLSHYVADLPVLWLGLGGGAGAVLGGRRRASGRLSFISAPL